MENKPTILDNEAIQNHIFTIRGVQVMLDRDLAELYNVETRALKQAVKRNKRRFPDDFILTLTESEIDLLVSQSVIPSKQHSRPFLLSIAFGCGRI